MQIANTQSIPKIRKQNPGVNYFTILIFVERLMDALNQLPLYNLKKLRFFFKKEIIIFKLIRDLDNWCVFFYVP